MALSVTNLGIDGLEDIEQIGTGGSSRVYKARQTDLDRVVAVKVLNTGDDQDMLRRFDRERKAMGRLSLHEGIVPVYSSGVTDHREPYLVMPYYPSGSLQDQIETGAMDWPTAVRYVELAADTIAAAHDEGVVHLDLKPANILLTVKGAPRIADFGIARLLTGQTAPRTNGNAAFTPAYSAPETFMEGETGPASDVYGLAATLWALLVGHPPFLTPGNDNTLMSVIGRVVNNPVGDLREFTPGPICDVIERAMAKQPGMRHQTAREFAEALETAAAASGSASVAGTAPGSATAGASALAAATADPTRQASVLFPGSGGRIDGTQTTNLLDGPELPASMASTIPPADPSPSRPLLQEAAQPMPRPAGPPPQQPGTPLFDFDRFGFGPILIGLTALVVAIVLAAFFVLGDSDGASNSTTITNPAAPSSDTSLPASSSEPSTSAPSATDAPGASSSLTSSSLPNTSPTSEPPTPTSAAATTVTTGSGTPSTTGSSTTDGNESSTTESTTSTTESTTSTTESTTSTTESTTSTTESTTSTTVAEEIQPPSNLSATPAADSVSLIWTAPASGPTPSAYQVMRDGTVLATVNATGYTDNDIAAGATYVYTVRSVGQTAADTSPPSASATATIPPQADPLSVTAVAAPGRTSIVIDITATRCIDYEVTVTPVDGGGPTTLSNTVPCDTTHNVRVARLNRNTEYNITVVGTSDDGDPVETDTFTITGVSTGGGGGGGN